MNKVTLFIKEVTARLQGDETTAIAIKNAKKAGTSIDSQTAALRSAIVDAETEVEEAEEALGNAKFPKELITDNKRYLDNIKAAQAKLDASEWTLANLQESLEYFENLKKEMFAEVEG